MDVFGTVAGLVEIQRVGEVGCLSVSLPQRRQVPARLDELEDRGCVIGGMVNEMPLGERRNDDCRVLSAIAPLRSVE
jgi:hypothetical protein